MIVSKWTGAEVRALREVALRMSQDELADRIGFKTPTVRKWEKATAARPVRGNSAAALDTLRSGISSRIARNSSGFKNVMTGGSHLGSLVFAHGFAVTSLLSMAAFIAAARKPCLFAIVFPLDPAVF
ncbi:helix-turn-helix domain-containing protein [Nocardia yunnanensis]|uniref:Helix-turn-helix domain-containing protein n=1 Tax=Nocardia yunnanensis TaxID=2382165 RepID=A0A386ZGC4_9NOCA|nr:helix-turn-helix domain-containing protein [Nocardia yunnanensis]